MLCTISRFVQFGQRKHIYIEIFEDVTTDAEKRDKEDKQGVKAISGSWQEYDFIDNGFSKTLLSRFK